MGPTPASSLAGLSERQRQCLALVACGYTSKEIARELGLSPSTIDNHLAQAVMRLGCSSRAVAAKIYLAKQTNVNAPQISRFDGDYSESASQVSRDASVREERTRPRWFLPPLGGSENRLSTERRLFYVLQIMILSLVVLFAVVITIAGVVHLFKAASPALN